MFGPNYTNETFVGDCETIEGDAPFDIINGEHMGSKLWGEGRYVMWQAFDNATLCMNTHHENEQVWFFQRRDPRDKNKGPIVLPSSVTTGTALSLVPGMITGGLPLPSAIGQTPLRSAGDHYSNEQSFQEAKICPRVGHFPWYPRFGLYCQFILFYSIYLTKCPLVQYDAFQPAAGR